MPHFTYSFRVRFREADPAGIVFFADVYRFAHDAYEEFIVRELGFEWKHWFQNPQWAVPIKTSTCEYFAPMPAAKEYTVSISIESLGTCSMTARYTIRDGDKVACVISLVHVFLKLPERSVLPIPSEVRGRLEAYQSQCLRTQELA